MNHPESDTYYTIARSVDEISPDGPPVQRIVIVRDAVRALTNGYDDHGRLVWSYDKLTALMASWSDFRRAIIDPSGREGSQLTDLDDLERMHAAGVQMDNPEHNWMRLVLATPDHDPVDYVNGSFLEMWWRWQQQARKALPYGFSWWVRFDDPGGSHDGLIFGDPDNSATSAGCTIYPISFFDNWADDQQAGLEPADNPMVWRHIIADPVIGVAAYLTMPPYLPELSLEAALGYELPWMLQSWGQMIGETMMFTSVQEVYLLETDETGVTRPLAYSLRPER